MVKKRPVNLKRLWGKVVFRYAGRNVCSHSARRTRKFYNLIGRFYDWIYTEHIEGYRQSVEYLANECISPGDRVLDVGCGTGYLIQLISDKVSWVVGLDLSRVMLKQAIEKQQLNEQIFYVAADCRRLPLRGPFDKIVSSFMLVILKRYEQQAVIQELAKLLRPGGELIFLTARDDISPQWLNREEWDLYCRNAGCEKVEVFDIFDYFRLVRAIRGENEPTIGS